MKKRKDGRYQKRITLPNGKSKLIYSSANTEREAIKDFNRQMLMFEAERQRSMNFNCVAEAWADERFPTLQYNTISSYKACMNEAVKYFGDVPVSEITSNNIKAYLDTLVKKSYAKKTIKERYAILKQIIFFALEHEYIEKNPCALIKLKTPKSAITPKREAASSDDEKTIKNLSEDVTFGFFAKFLLFTGCRRGEAFAIMPKNINFENKSLSIKNTVEWIGNTPRIKECPKTDAGVRDIPIPDILVPGLLKRKEQKYIFENETHDLMKHSDIDKYWDALKRETGISCTPHQLRHSYATMLFDAGIDVKTAQRWLGHSDIKTTLDIYTHLSSMRQEQSINKWFDFVNTNI